MRLTGAIALVTGGSSGIGAATARALAGAGARLLIAGRDPARLRAVASQTGGIALTCDLAASGGPADLAAAAQRAAATLPPAPGVGETTAGIDILVNNAGVGWAGPIGEIAAEKIAELVTVNLTAPMQLTRLLAPGMIARGRGRVVFVSSIAATGVRGEAVYSATKAGLGSFGAPVRPEKAAPPAPRTGCPGDRVLPGTRPRRVLRAALDAPARLAARRRAGNVPRARHPVRRPGLRGGSLA